MQSQVLRLHVLAHRAVLQLDLWTTEYLGVLTLVPWTDIWEHYEGHAVRGASWLGANYKLPSPCVFRAAPVVRTCGFAVDGTEGWGFVHLSITRAHARANERA